MSPVVLFSAGRRLLTTGSSFQPAADGLPRLLLSSGRRRLLTTGSGQQPGKSPAAAGKVAGKSLEESLRELREEFHRQREKNRTQHEKWNSDLTRLKSLFYCTITVVSMGVAGSLFVPRKKKEDVKSDHGGEEVVYVALGTTVCVVGGKRLVLTVDLKKKEGKAKMEKTTVDGEKRVDSSPNSRLGSRPLMGPFAVTTTAAECSESGATSLSFLGSPSSPLSFLGSLSSPLSFLGSG